MKKRTAKKAARRARRPRKAAAKSPTLRTVLLGRPLSLRYQHAGGGSYVHKFSRGARVSATPDGRMLVIDNIQIKQFIEG